MEKVTLGSIELYNADCMDLLREMPDKSYDLAIVDPPYGIGEDGSKSLSRGRGKLFGKTNKGSALAYAKYYKPFAGNDKLPPPIEYFQELKRVSKNQIIWGANHFIENIPNANSSSWVVWDKDNGDNDFADCELAYTSFKSAVRKFKWRWNGMLQENMSDKEVRIHPTQKPVALYKWLLTKYANDGDRILDTHLGSGSIAIACHDLNFELTGIELDSDYFHKAVHRIKEHQRQLKLF